MNIPGPNSGEWFSLVSSHLPKHLDRLSHIIQYLKLQVVSSEVYGSKSYEENSSRSVGSEHLMATSASEVGKMTGT